MYKIIKIFKEQNWINLLHGSYSNIKFMGCTMFLSQHLFFSLLYTVSPLNQSTKISSKLLIIRLLSQTYFVELI